MDLLSEIICEAHFAACFGYLGYSSGAQFVNKVYLKGLQVDISDK